jgi:hypothetical protein
MVFTWFIYSSIYIDPNLRRTQPTKLACGGIGGSSFFLVGCTWCPTSCLHPSNETGERWKRWNVLFGRCTLCPTSCIHPSNETGVRWNWWNVLFGRCTLCPTSCIVRPASRVIPVHTWTYMPAMYYVWSGTRYLAVYTHARCSTINV